MENKAPEASEVSKASEVLEVSDNVYDNVIKTEFERHKSLFIPLINKYMGMNFTRNAEITD